MIHCIGNSHVNTFSGSNKVNFLKSENTNFTLYHLGPVIAYNFQTSHMPKVRNILKTIPKNDYVTLCVGEVDCRLHLPKQADLQSKSDKEIVEECVNRLIQCYEEISKTHKILITTSHPTTISSGNGGEGSEPIYGNMKRRNNICLIWNKLLLEYAKLKQLRYIDIYFNLVDENNNTKMDYFFDYCHLNSSKVMPFILSELYK